METTIKIIVYVGIIAIVAIYTYRRLNIYGVLTSKDKKFIQQITQEAEVLSDPIERKMLLDLIHLATTKLDLDILCTETIYLIADVIESAEAVRLAQKIADYPFHGAIA